MLALEICQSLQKTFRISTNTVDAMELYYDYATKKQEDGSISESEVTGRLVKRKCVPAKNERTRVQRKKK